MRHTIRKLTNNTVMWFGKVTKIIRMRLNMIDIRNSFGCNKLSVKHVCKDKNEKITKCQTSCIKNNVR